MKKVPTPEDIVASHPPADEGRRRVRHDRTEVRESRSVRDPRRLLAVGPSSAWPEIAGETLFTHPVVLDAAEGVRSFGPVAASLRLSG